MAKLEPLNLHNHRRLRVRARDRDGRIFIPIVASEFAAAAATCPILFSKSPETGRFYAGAMFGFRPEEPPLTAEDGFVPSDLERQGFFVSGDDIAVDLDHPRISETAGEPLFDEEGQPTVHLCRIQRALGQLTLGTEPTDAFIRALLDLKLIEPIDVSLRFDDGETLHLEGLYTVSRDRLHELDDADALRLFRNGYLQLADTMVASLQQIPLMADRRNRRLTEGI
ncbi:MAG: SapC family protein [Rhizomicrobium sp.]